MKKPKALVLFSGGLDSLLVMEILKENNIDVEAVFFILPFSKKELPKIKGFVLHTIDATKSPLFEEYLEIIKNPKHGLGVSMNPCKDCRIFMFKKAKELMDKINADFIATGEVLAQRPNSQHKSQMIFIERKAEIEGRVLRPLSAKLMPETIAEKNKLVKRDNLFKIEGRSRKKQIELANKYNLKYPLPTGGCKLCEKGYSLKLSDLLKNKTEIKPVDIELLGFGRHFRSKGKIIVGKNDSENLRLIELNKTLGYNILIPSSNGPVVIFENNSDNAIAKSLQKAYLEKDQDLINKLNKLRIN